MIDAQTVSFADPALLALLEQAADADLAGLEFGVIGFDAPAYVVAENAGTLRINVLRTNGSSGVVNAYFGDFGAMSGRAGGLAGGGGAGGKEQKLREVVKESLSEYFLYSVEGRDTIPTGWSKRLPSFNTPAVTLAPPRR